MKTTPGAEEQRAESVYELVPVPAGRMGRIGRSTHYLVGEELLYTPSGKGGFWSLLPILEIAELALTFICTQIFAWLQPGSTRSEGKQNTSVGGRVKHKMRKCRWFLVTGSRG